MFFPKILKYIPDSGLSRLCTLDFMLGPLNGRKKTSGAAELAELKKSQHFKKKNTIFKEHPVVKKHISYISYISKSEKLKFEILEILWLRDILL